MFQSQTTETKLALLEEKLNIYEQMMRKIESAIEKISETSQTISKMLAIHEERLEQTSKADEVIISMVHDIKKSNTEEHKPNERSVVHDNELVSRPSSQALLW